MNNKSKFLNIDEDDEVNEEMQESQNKVSEY